MGQPVPASDLPSQIVPDFDLPEGTRVFPSIADISSNPLGWQPRKVSPVRNTPTQPEPGSDYYLKLEDVINRREPGIDYYTGVENALLRAGFSRMSNDEEKTNFLTKNVGADNFGKDKFGAWYIKPKGLERLGIKSKIPISLDEQRISKYDLADWAGDIPVLLGATGYAMASTGLGAPAGIGMTALGAATGRAFDEIIKVLQGYNLKSPLEMAGELTREGAAAALGEGIFRGGARLFKGYSPGISPERKEMTREALGQGLTPKTWQFGAGPLLTRFQATAERVIGDPTVERNREILTGMQQGLQGRAGEPVENIGERLVETAKQRTAAQATEVRSLMSQANSELEISLKGIRESLGSKDPEIGTAVAESIRSARRKFGEDAAALYGKVDDMIGEPFIPTVSLKAQAARIADRLPRTEGGRVVFTKAGEANPIDDILSLPETITLSQAQRIRTQLREGTTVRDLVPGVDKRDLGLLKEASETMFNDAANTLGFTTRSTILGPNGQPITTMRVLPAEGAVKAIAALRQADAFYRAGIKKFDYPAIAAITRDASQTGSVEADRVIDYIIKPGQTAAAQRVKSLVSGETWGKIARAHFDDLIESSKSLVNGEDQIIGKRLYDKVQDLGRTLDVVYGDKAANIRKYAAFIAARDGKIDPASLTGDLAQTLETAALKQKRLDDFMKDNYLAQLAKPGQEAEQAVDYIFRPRSPGRILEAKKYYGEASPEFKGMQNAAMEKLLSSFVERTEDPLIKVLNGAALRQNLDRYGEATLRAAFGDELTRDLYKFANLAEFVTKKGPYGAGGIVAANVALHPISNAGKIADIFVTSRLLRTPGVIRWLSEGINPDTPAKEAAAALARVSTLATAIVNDKTGAARLNTSAPERPEIAPSRMQQEPAPPTISSNVSADEDTPEGRQRAWDEIYQRERKRIRDTGLGFRQLFGGG